MKLEFDMTDLQRNVIEPLQASQRRVKAAVAVAFTKVGGLIRDAERAEMEDVFDRPKPYTLNSLYLKPARGNDAVVQAEVGLKDQASEGRPATSWLRWQIEGGLRRTTGFEESLIRGGAMPSDMRAVPGRGAKLDAFGNVSRGQMQQVLSQLRIETGLLGSTRALTAYSFEDTKKQRRFKATKIRRAYGKAGGQFVALPRGRGKLRPGVYQAEGRDFGARLGYGRNGRMTPIFIFVTKAEYEAEHFDFHYVAQMVVNRELVREVTAQVSASMQRLVAQRQAGSA
jgi:hypothetical protein